MKRIRSAASEVGIGLAAIYLFFLIPQISSIFSDSFVLMLRQGCIIGFAISLGINPHKLIDYGIKMSPKIKAIMDILAGGSNDKPKE